MRPPLRSGFGVDPRRPGPVTLWLCIATVAVSVLTSVTQRLTGYGVAHLVFTVPDVLNLELWRVFTYPFAVTSAFQLLLNVLFLYLLGTWFESTYGSRELARFFAASSVGAALLAIPLHFVLRYLPLMSDVPVASGPGPALDAMLVAIALNAPDSNVMYGFVLPVRARMLVWVVIGFQVIGGLMSGSAMLSITLAGLGIGYLLIMGNWRPTRWLRRGARRKTRARQGLYVVPPKDKTLH